MSGFTFVDLFCGGGLGARGAVSAGGRPIAAVDLWSIATKTYRDNFPGANVLTGNIADIHPDTATGGQGVDLLIASPECTNHSNAKGALPRCEISRDSAMLTLDWIRALRPPRVVIENVGQMRSWARYDELHDSLTVLGYGVREDFLDAADFGVPQSRKRLYITCTLDADPPRPESPGLARQPASSILDPRGTWSTSPLNHPRRATATLERAERAMANLGHRTPFLMVYYGSDGGGGWQSLDVPLRTITTLDRFALVEYTGEEHRMRMLQPSELLRAMGVSPDRHRLIHGNRRDKVRLCGNGVCAPVMHHIVSGLVCLGTAAPKGRSSCVSVTCCAA